MAENYSLPTASELKPMSDFNVPQLGQLQSTAAFKDVQKLNQYIFVENTYTGEYGYRDCSYLIPNDKETFYETRRKISYYVNVFKPIISAMIDPVFSAEIKRESTNDMFDDFIENCDNAGTPLNIFMRNAIRNARLFSINFVVMDNFSSAVLEHEETTEQLIKNRKYPYIYEKKPYEVYEHETNEQGGLISITFQDRCEEMTIGGKEEEVQFYRQWDSVGWTLFYIGKKKEEVVVETGTHNLGMIPVVCIVDFANSANLEELPCPELYDMARLCFGLFNKESQVCDMELRQTFAVFCTSGMGKSAIVLSQATFIDSGTESKYPPQYVSPAQEGIKVLVDNCQRLKEEIKDQAKQKGVIGIKEQSSGIAKEWDFRAEEQVLQQTAKAGERVEELLAELFGLYIGSAIDYVVEYPERFDPKANENAIAERLLILKDVTDRTIIKYINLDIAEKLWGKNEDKLALIKAEMEQSTIENATISAMMDESAVNNNIGQ